MGGRPAVHARRDPRTRWGGRRRSPARDESYFAGARLDDPDLKAAAADDRARRAAARQRHADAVASNLGLGHDIRAALADPSREQMDAVRRIVCHLLADGFTDVIAYGAGWTDRERQHPVGDTSRTEPRHVDAIVAAELDRALADPEPLHGIAQLITRWSAAFLLDPDGVPRTTGLGSDLLTRRLREALPDDARPMREAVWALMRPALSPRLSALHADEFISFEAVDSTVDLATHRGESALYEIELDDAPTASGV